MAPVIAHLGGTWSPENQEALVGGPLEKAVDMLIAQSDGTHDHDEVMTLLLRTMEQQLRTKPVHWRPGARELVVRLKVRRVPRVAWTNVRGLQNHLLEPALRIRVGELR